MIGKKPAKTGGLTVRKPLRWYVRTAVVVVTGSLLAGASISSTQAATNGDGSLALGVASGSGAVDPQTGALSFSVGLGAVPGVGASQISLGLTFSPSAPADAGLGAGLSWGLPRVTAGGSMFSWGGNAFPVDVATVAGLQGYLLRDAVFEVHQPPLAPGEGQCVGERPCAFTMTTVDGNVDAFDTSGLLSSRADRDGNLSLYAWDDGERLTSVTGGFPGAAVTASVQYPDQIGGDEIVVSFPKRSDGVTPQARLLIAGGVLEMMTDTAGRQVDVDWTQESADGIQTWLVSDWTTSAGSRTNVTYQSYGGGIWAVDTLQTTGPSGELSPVTTVNLNPAGNEGRNYTGYPNHLGPAPEGSQTVDALVASNDRSYTYQTSISDGVTTTLRTYNWLHQLISLDNTQVVGGSAKTILSTQIQYPEPSADWPNVSPNYQTPTATTTTVTDPTSGSTRTVTTTAVYDDLGRQTSQTVDGVRTDTCYDSGQTEPTDTPIPAGCPTPQDGRGFGQILQVTSTVVEGANTGAVQQQQVALTDDRHNPHTVTGMASEPSGPGPLATTSETVLGFDSHGQVVSSQVSGHGADGQAQLRTQSASYQVAGEKREVELTDADGSVTRTLMDASSGLVLEVSLPSGIVNSYGYDAGGRVVQVTTPETSVAYTYTEAGFDGSGVNETVTTRAADGYQVKTVMDALGRELSKSDNQIQGAVSATGWRQLSAQKYDLRGNIVTRIDQAGLATTSTFDPETGMLAAVSYPDKTSVSFTYDAGAGTTSATTHDDAGKPVSTHTQTVDDAGRTTEQTSAFADNSPGQTVSTSYSGFGAPTQVNNSSTALTTTTTRNSYGDVTEATQTGPDVSATAGYGSSVWGQLVSQSVQMSGSVGDGSTDSPISGFDDIGRRTSRTDQTGQSEYFEYDTVSRPAQVAEPDGRSQHFQYDPDTGSMAQMWWTLPDEPQAPVDERSYSYDPVTGNISAVWYATDETQSKVSYENYPDGTPKTVSYPGGGTLRYMYADNGQLSQLTDPVGTETTYTYDPPTGRLLSATQLGATAAYQYDGRGNLVTVTRTVGQSTIGTTTYTWDDASRMLSSTSTDSANENLETRNYTWDEHSRLATEEVTLGATVPLPDSGALAGERATSTTYAYDGFGRLNGEKTVRSSDGATLIDTTYTSGPSGTLKQVVTQTAESTTTTSYTTDAAGRQTAITTAETGRADQTAQIAWDAAGRQTNDRAGNSYTYTTDGFLAGWTAPNNAATTLSWRADGTLGTQTNPDGSSTTTYQLPSETSPVIAQVTTNSAGTSATSSLIGHAREATITGAAVQDSSVPLGAHTDPSSANPEVRSFQRILPGCPSGPDATPTEPGTPTPTPTPGDPDPLLTANWLLTNYRGDVTTVIDHTGAPAQHTDYTAYGTATTASVRNAEPSVFGYTGALTLDTGLVHLNARQYDPGTGQFTSKDTVTSTNLYLYANANPVLYTDPTGRLPHWIHDVIKWGSIALAVVGIIASTVGIATGGGAVLGIVAELVNVAAIGAPYATQVGQLATHRKLSAKVQHVLNWVGVGLSIVGVVLGGTDAYLGLRGRFGGDAEAATETAARPTMNETAKRLQLESRDLAQPRYHPTEYEQAIWRHPDDPPTIARSPQPATQTLDGQRRALFDVLKSRTPGVEYDPLIPRNPPEWAAKGLPTLPEAPFGQISPPGVPTATVVGPERFSAARALGTTGWPWDEAHTITTTSAVLPAARTSWFTKFAANFSFASTDDIPSTLVSSW